MCEVTMPLQHEAGWWLLSHALFACIDFAPFIGVFIFALGMYLGWAASVFVGQPSTRPKSEKPEDGAADRPNLTNNHYDN